MNKKFKPIIILILLIHIPISLNLYAYYYSPIIPINFLAINSSNQKKYKLSANSLELISKNSYKAYDPVIAIDSKNISHIVWYAYNKSQGTHNILYTNSTDNFTNIQRISNVSTNDDDPSIAIDSSDNVHICWEGSDQIYYTNSSVNYTIHSNVSNQEFVDNPQIVCDSSGFLHIAWMGYQTDNWDIYYSNSSDLFSNNIKVTNDSIIDEDPDLCVNNGIVHIVWSKQNGKYDYLIVYSNSSDNFTNKIIISQELHSNNAPKITMDNAGNVHIVWSGQKVSKYDINDLLLFYIIFFYLPYYNDADYLPRRYSYLSLPSFTVLFYLIFYFKFHIYYSNSTNNFQTQLDISKSSSHNAYFPDIVVDSNNITHIIWAGFDANYLQPKSSLFYTNSSQNFSKFNYFAIFGIEEVPRIANDSSNNIHCVFAFDYEGTYSIYYFNGSDLRSWTKISKDLWKLLQIWLVTPNRPDRSILTIILISIIGVLNLAAILISVHKKRENRR